MPRKARAGQHRSLHFTPARSDAEGLRAPQKREALRQAAFNLGRPALLRSGGASMGFVHLGVAKALYEQKLLPDVISGSSLGSLVAAGLGGRTPASWRNC